ncbi:unnamed protein product [Adineta steineri]|uniref:Uncharacterized protein n=1 Tax=Adineta steineri TaxID=433720 RepID=A0A816B7Z3_9BILA|nr:unnamed protein product [Adineta steineri]CAF1606670.1 unnamed protein product [Adineta steineri]
MIIHGEDYDKNFIKGTQEYHDYQDDIYENEILLLTNRYVIGLNLLDYFYSIFFGKTLSFSFEHRLNALEKFILKILTSVINEHIEECYTATENNIISQGQRPRKHYQHQSKLVIVIDFDSTFNVTTIYLPVPELIFICLAQLVFFVQQ